MLFAVTGEEGWNRPEESVGSANHMLREMLVENINAHFADRPDLVEKCTPNYPPGAKRALVDDGRYFAALSATMSVLTLMAYGKSMSRGY